MLRLLLLLPTTGLLLVSRLLMLMMMLLPLMPLRLELLLLLVLLLLLPLMLQPPTPALFLLLLLLLVDLAYSFLETQFPTHPQNGHLQEKRFSKIHAKGQMCMNSYGRVRGVAAE